MQTRRGFLGMAAATAAGAQEEWRNRQAGMTYRLLGRTNFRISSIVMGGNLIAPDLADHVLHALDLGLNYLDTAPDYGKGKSEEGYARVLKARPRDRFFLTTKVSAWSNNRNKTFAAIFDSLAASDQAKIRAEAREEIERRHADAPDYLVGYFNGQMAQFERAALSNAMERRYGRRIDRDKDYRRLILDSLDNSLRVLGTDYVDVLMCPHACHTPYEMLNFPETFEAFETARKAGKARFLGVSAHTDPAGVLEAAVQSKMYSVAMVAYNIVNHRYVDPALEQAAKAGVGVIAMKVARPVHPGPGRGRPPADPARVRLIEEAVPGKLKTPQKAYVWALRNPNLSAVVSEMDSRAIVDENLALVR